MRHLPLILAVIAFAVAPHSLSGRNFRPAQIPNGANFNCQNCHFSPSGGGLRNSFGNAVNAKIGGSPLSVAFWDAALAAADADGDGFTNGQELGDLDGDGIAERTTGISNPGDASSTPTLPNSAPGFTSSAVLAAIKGEPYSYQATATDPDQHFLTFSKVSGPTWLSVGTDGRVSGTPPDDNSLSEAVTVRVTDNGSPPASADQSFTIDLTATFAGWVKLHFSPGTDAATVLAQDPDADGIPNLVEFALRTSPTTTDSFAFAPSVTGGQPATFFIDVRDDAPGLGITAEAADNLPFNTVTTLTPQVSDPSSGDGRQRLTFTDVVSPAADTRRFLRLRFSHP